MSVDGIRAAQAYEAIARIGASAPRPAAAPEAGPASFGALVQAAVAETAGTMKAGEAAASAVARGEAGLVDVVTAVSAAEVTLETAIAIRNKVVEAYQEIMRMPI